MHAGIVRILRAGGGPHLNFTIAIVATSVYKNNLLFPARSDYSHQSVALLRIKKAFIHQALVELTNRYDVDTIIEGRK